MVWSDEARRESARVRHLKALLNAHRVVGKGGVRTLRRATSTHKLAKRIRSTRPGKGGFTYNPKTLGVPKRGNVVSVYPNRTKQVRVAVLKASDIYDFFESNKDLLSKPGHYAGGWRDPRTGIVWLDISVVVSDPETARQLCLENDQEGWFNIETKETEYVSEAEREAWRKTRPRFG